MRDYPLRVNDLDTDDTGDEVYYSKGHHDPEAFVAAICRAYDTHVGVEHVRHAFSFWAFSGTSRYRHVLTPGVAGRRGCFPTTIAVRYGTPEDWRLPSSDEREANREDAN